MSIHFFNNFHEYDYFVVHFEALAWYESWERAFSTPCSAWDIFIPRTTAQDKTRRYIIPQTAKVHILCNFTSFFSIRLEVSKVMT